MDVVVSHHPEYTALVWGAMKFFFVVSTASSAHFLLETVIDLNACCRRAS